MFDRIRSGWELTKKAWGVIRAHPRLAKLPLTGGALALVVFVLVGVPGALVLDGEGGGATAAGVVLLAVGGYLASFVVIYFNVALAAAADQALRGEEPDIPAARRVARSRIGTIAAWALVSAVVSAVLGLLNDRGGIAGRIGAAIGGAIWALVTFLVVPVLAAVVGASDGRAQADAPTAGASGARSARSSSRRAESSSPSSASRLARFRNVVQAWIQLPACCQYSRTSR